MEPGAPSEDAGHAPAEDGDRAPDFDGDYQKSLRHSWEFAAIAQFCRLFSSALRLRPFSADQLEAALLEPDEHPMFLGELLYKLLKKERDEAYTEKAAFSWEPMLVRKLDAQWPHAFTAHPMADSDFYAIDPLSRMNIIYALCEWRLDEDNAVREHVRQQVDTSDMADTLRHLPIGEDSKGFRYYFFSDSQEDCRLYREEAPRTRLGKKQAHREHLALWDTVCTTLEEISDFAAGLGGSRNKSDKALHEFLTLELLPKLIDTVSARKKADERAAALEAMPKKRSSRLQVLQIKKEEEEKKKREEGEERARMLKEQERVRKDRDREMRLRARQDEEERMLMHAAQLRKKLGVMEPSREERYSKRIRTADDSSNPSPGISGLTDTEHEPFREINQEQSEPNQQAEQKEHNEENGVALDAAPEQVVKQDIQLEPKAEAPQPPQPINLYPNFPMPPDMGMGMGSMGPAADPWQGEEQADGGYMLQGRQLRQRQLQQARGRKREHSPGWSPIGVNVQKRLRHVNTRRSSNMSVLAKFGKPLPPPRLDDYYEGADLSSSSESEEKPPPRSRGRRRRAKSEDSDPDYEGERSERSGGRPTRGRGSRRTTAASNATASAHQEQSHGHGYSHAQRQQQEQHYQRQQLMARYQSATPLEQERIKQQLMAQRQQQMMQQQGFMPGLSASMPGSPSMGGFDSQAALRQQMAMQQRQEAMRLLSTLAPEQREQLGRLPPVQQNQFLEQLRQNHMAQQREAARQQQAAAVDAHRQQDLQQRLLASLSAQQLQQLRSMPREAQQASLNGLMQRYHMAEQQRQMQRQQAMQHMGQTLDPADSSFMQNSQHMSGPQAFLQQQRAPPGHVMGGQSQALSLRSMHSPRHFSQGQPSSPGLQSSMPDQGMGDWRRQGPQAGFQHLRPSSGMPEPHPVEFGMHAGSAAGAQQPLHLGGSGFGPLPGGRVPSPQAQGASGDRDAGAPVRLGHIPGSDVRPSLHGTPHPEGQRYEGIEQGTAPQAEVSGSPRYGAPVTTGQDKSQNPAQAHGAPDRGSVSSAQVTSGAPPPAKPGTGQQASQQQSANQQHPASSAEPAVVIITSSTPPSMGLQAPIPSKLGSQASPRQQHYNSSSAAGQPSGGALEEDRCPSPIPVTLDDFGSGHAEEAGTDDLQGLDLPWASQQPQSSANPPSQDKPD